MRTKSKIITGVILIIVVFALKRVPSFFFKPEEIEFCKSFLSNNPNINEYFGKIKSIKVVHSGGSRGINYTNRRKISRGVYHFRVNGMQKDGTVRMRWQESGGRMKVSRVWMREGLVGTRMLWPEFQTTTVGYILPSHVWDGFIYIGITGLCLLFYFGLKKRCKWAEFVFFIVSLSDKIRAITKYACVVGACISAIESILCFLNISMLF